MSDFLPAPSSSPLHDKLTAFPFYSQLSSAGQQQMLNSVSSCQLPTGDLLMTEGSECQALLLVERGGIRVYKLAPSGREITLYRVGPGESCVLGTTCIINHKGYPALAMVANQIDALAVPAQLFRSLYETETAIRSFVMELFSQRFSNLMLLVEEVAFARMDERLTAFLIEHAVSGPGLTQPIRMSHDEIAAHLGTAREVVSRLLQQFSDQGLITLARKRIEIDNLTGLKRLREGL